MHQTCGRRSLISSRVLVSPSSLGMASGRDCTRQGGKAQIMSCANMGMGSELQRPRRWWAPPSDQGPGLLPPSPAPRRPGPVAENSSSVASSFSMSGWKANQITVAKAAPQQAHLGRTSLFWKHQEKTIYSQISKPRIWNHHQVSQVFPNQVIQKICFI